MLRVAKWLRNPEATRYSRISVCCLSGVVELVNDLKMAHFEALLITKFCGALEIGIKKDHMHTHVKISFAAVIGG